MNKLTSALKVHVALNVRNVEASVDFYRRVFGIEPVKLRAGYAKFDVEFPAVNLALNESAPEGPDDRKLTHELRGGKGTA